MTFGDCGPKNVRSFGEMDWVDLALGEFGLCSWVTFFALVFPGTDGGVFAFCSGRELVMDLSFEMKDTMLAVLRGYDDWIRVLGPLSLRDQCYNQRFEGRCAIATKNVG